MKRLLLLMALVWLSNMARAQWPIGYFTPEAEPFAYNTSGNHNAAVEDFALHRNATVSMSTSSDGRFERNMEDVAGLEFTNTLTAASYTLDDGALTSFWKIADSVKQQSQNGRESHVRQGGVIPQHVEAALEKGNYNFNGVSDPKNTTDHYYSIRYDQFVMRLLKTVRELTGLLNEQSKEINALKRQIAATANEIGTVGQITGTTRVATLSQNHLSSLSTETEIEVSLPEASTNANLVFYTLEGKQLKLLHLYNRGNFIVKVDSNDLTRGVCFYALMIDGKMIDSKQLLTN